MWWLPPTQGLHNYLNFLSTLKYRWVQINFPSVSKMAWSGNAALYGFPMTTTVGAISQPFTESSALSCGFLCHHCLWQPPSPQKAYRLFRFGWILEEPKANCSHCCSDFLMCFTCFLLLFLGVLSLFTMYMTVVAKSRDLFLPVYTIFWEGSPFS